LPLVRRRSRAQTKTKPESSLELANTHVVGSRDTLKPSSDTAGKSLLPVMSTNQTKKFGVAAIKTPQVETMSGTALSSPLSTSQMSQLKRTRSRNNSESAALEGTGLSDQPLKKRPRPVNLSLSSRTLGNSFDAHMPSVGVDENPGSSLNDDSPSSRNSKNGTALRARSNPKSQMQSHTTTFAKLEMAGSILPTSHTVVRPEKPAKRTKLIVSDKKLPVKASEKPVVEPPAPDNSVTKPVANNRPSRSYSQSSQGLKKPEPRTDLSHADDATIFRQRSGSLSKAPSPIVPTVPTLQTPVQKRGLAPPSSLISSISPGATITVDAPFDTSSPAVAKNARNKKQPGHGINSQGISPVSLSSSEAWNSNRICQDSVLTYATSVDWPEVGIDKKGRVVRQIKAEREGVFRATGVLMGVRFVVGL
jgi:hypothetical protein